MLHAAARFCLVALMALAPLQVVGVERAEAATPLAAPAVSPSQPYVGQNLTVSSVVPGRFARTVSLQSWNGTGYATRATKRSAGSGAYAFTHASSASSVRLRVVVSAGRHRGRTYPAVTTRVKVVAQRPGTLTVVGPGTVKEEASFTVAVAMAPAAAGRSIFLERRDEHAWIVVGRTTSNPTGRSEIQAAAARGSATQQYRARVPSSGQFPALTSDTAVVDVLRREPIARLTIDTVSGTDVTSGSEYVRGTMTLDPRDSGLMASTLSSRFRVRGNSTAWVRGKLSYKIKLDTKSSVAGFPASKDWALLANFYDRSMLRNDTAFEAARRIGMKWSPRMRFVELTVNGKLKGLYQLGESVEKAQDRVSLPAGGVLLEADHWEDDEPHFTTGRGLKINLKDPDDSGETLTAEVAAGVQATEDAIYAEDFADPTTGYRAHIDVDSFVDWYLVNELTKNIDSTYLASVWMSWSEGRVAMAAPWDFDFSSGNRDVFDIMDPTGWYLRRNWWSEQLSRPGSMMTGPEGHWLVRLMSDPWFEQRVEQRWREVAPQLRGLPDHVRTRAADIERAAKRNFAPLAEGGAGHPIGLSFLEDNATHVFRGSWPAETTALTDWLQRRIAWMDSQLGPTTP